MNFILCIESTFKYFEDYLNSIKNVFIFKLILIKQDTMLEINKYDNYIFVQIIPNYILNQIDNSFLNIFLINTEQLSVISSRDKLNLYPKNILMIDYLSTNLKYLETSFQKYLLPYQINYNEIYSIPKSKDICLIGDIIPSYRQIIIDKLRLKNINVDIISGFSLERDNKLFKYKILLNISYFSSNNCKVFETLRCDRCIYNKMIVISDLKEDIESYYLKKYVIFEDYDKIPDKVENVINNYKYYYNNLYSSFSFNEIQNKINDLSQEIKILLN